MKIAKLKEIVMAATEGPWTPVDRFSEEWQETYYGIQTEDERPIGTFDGDNAVWLKQGEGVANRILAIAFRNLAPEVLALVEVLEDCLYGSIENPPGNLVKAFDAFNSKLESL